jgi:putative N6-adenine-specific DNA methylase
VAERIHAAIARAVPGVVASSAGDDDETEAGDAQLFVVRVFHDVVVISADTTGALLHRRGYRLATAKAPIRENLAAAMLLSVGWDGARPMVDPMCGAGTLAIEAALIARKMAPGLQRTFACERWPLAPLAAFAAERKLALSRVLPASAVPIVASDRDAGAVEAARANAVRAGVDGDVALAQRSLSAMSPPPGPGLVIVNPPYGARVGESAALRDLYAQLGNVVRARCAGWTLAFLSADRTLERQVKLPLVEALRFKNGGIAVRLVRAEVPTRE